MRYAVGRWDIARWDRKIGRRFTVAGRSTATSAAADEVAGHLWNPSGTRSLWVIEFSVGTAQNQATLDPLRLCRTTTAGTTPSSSVTADPDNDYERETAPNTGAVLHLGNFATEPVLQLPPLDRLAFPTTGAPHQSIGLYPLGIKVPPGTGLGLATTGAIACPATDFSFGFWE